MSDQLPSSESSASYWDAVAESWQHRPPQVLWRHYCDQLHVALLRRWMNDRARPDVLKTDLFDEAFGEGLIGYLIEHAGSVTGIDLSPAIVERVAGRHATLNAVVADVRKLPFADGSFDLIVSNSTLDHFPSADQVGVALVELSRILRPGGQLLLTMDNPANPLIALRNGPLGPRLRRLGIVPYYVGATLAPAALARAVRAAGLEVKERTAIMHCPRVLAVALASRLDRRNSVATVHQWFLNALQGFERLGRLPTKYFTGHFVAIRAVKPGTGRSA